MDCSTCCPVRCGTPIWSVMISADMWWTISVTRMRGWSSTYADPGTMPTTDRVRLGWPAGVELWELCEPA